jgi:aminoglycoside phosphotransferase
MANIILQPENPVWLAEIGLAIGYERGTYQAITRDWLYWYDEQGVRYLSPEERAISAEQRAERLAEELRKLGINPDTL